MYRDLLAYCPDSRHWLAVADYARQLVSPGGAGITCLFDMPADMAGVGAAFASESIFRQIRRPEGPLVDGLALHAAWADLVVLGGVDELSALRTLVCACTRPCLLVPQGNAGQSAPRRVAIGWNDSLPCRRAVHAALPLLRAAQHVVVFAAAAPPIDTTAPVRYLERHGISAAVTGCPSDPAPNVGTLLLDLTEQHEVDLLVLGAFAHSEFGDWTGTETLTIELREAGTPLLLCH